MSRSVYKPKTTDQEIRPLLDNAFIYLFFNITISIIMIIFNLRHKKKTRTVKHAMNSFFLLLF